MFNNLIKACKTGNLDEAKSLVENGVDLNFRTLDDNGPLIEACANNQTEVAKYFIDKVDLNQTTISYTGNAKSALIGACTNNNEELIKLLVNKGADVNTEEGITPLQIACSFGNLNMVKFLVENGADIVDVADFQGETPLSVAIDEDYPEVVKYLIDKGADIEERNPNGLTPLMTAFSLASIEISEILLEAGASIDAVDYDDKTALDHIWDEEFRSKIMPKLK